MTPPRPSEAGFALPAAIFTLTLISLIASVGFLLAWLDGRAARSFRVATEAFYIAEGGLATAVATAVGPTPSLPAVPLGRGSATVAFESVLDLGPGERLFRVESVGRVLSEGVPHERRVHQLVWVADPPRAPAALVASGDVLATRTSGRVSGVPAGAACGPSAAGIATWTGTVWGATPPLTVSGSPPIQTGTSGSLTSATGIRWAELTAPHGPVPDATLPGQAWPGPSIAGGWPYVRFSGAVTLGPARSGQGTLVVTGDALLTGGFDWTGLVLVGGTTQIAGPVRIRGALMTGMGGSSAVAADLRGHAIDLEYDPCAVRRAATRLTSRPAAVAGTWSEAW